MTRSDALISLPKSVNRWVPFFPGQVFSAYEYVEDPFWYELLDP